MTSATSSLSKILRAPLTRGLAWTLSGTVGARAVALLGSVVIARVLGREAYGAFGLISNTSAMFQTFAGLGLGIAVTKLVAEHRSASVDRTGETIAIANVVAVVLGSTCAIAVALGATRIAASALGAPGLASEVRISAAALPLGAIWGVQIGALVGMQAFRAVAATSLLSGIATTAATVAGGALGGVAGAIWGSVAGAAAGGLIAQVLLNGEASRLGIRRGARTWRMAPALVRLAIPTFLAGAVVTPTTWSCSAMLGWQQDGFSELGLLNVATQWFGALLMIPALVSQVILPALAQGIAGGDRVAVRVLLKRALLANGLVAAAIAALISAGAPVLIGVYGDEFREAVPALVVMLFAAALVAVQSPIAQLLTAADKMWWSFFMNLAWAAVTLALTYALIERGALGVALARLLAYLLHTAWMIAFAKRALGAWEASLDAQPAG